MKGYAKTYKCVNCRKVINPMHNHVCPFCGSEQPLEDRAYALGDTIVDIKCEKCGFEESFYRSDSYMDVAYCPKCGETTYSNTDGKKPMLTYAPVPEIECPYCHSKNTKKISGMSKAGNIAIWGIFSIGKVTKQWHCNNCKSDF